MYPSSLRSPGVEYLRAQIREAIYVPSPPPTRHSGSAGRWSPPPSTLRGGAASNAPGTSDNTGPGGLHRVNSNGSMESDLAGDGTSTYSAAVGMSTASTGRGGGPAGGQGLAVDYKLAQMMQQLRRANLEKHLLLQEVESLRSKLREQASGGRSDVMSGAGSVGCSSIREMDGHIDSLQRELELKRREHRMSQEEAIAAHQEARLARHTAALIILSGVLRRLRWKCVLRRWLRWLVLMRRTQRPLSPARKLWAQAPDAVPFPPRAEAPPHTAAATATPPTGGRFMDPPYTPGDGGGPAPTGQLAGGIQQAHRSSVQQGEAQGGQRRRSMSRDKSQRRSRSEDPSSRRASVRSARSQTPSRRGSRYDGDSPRAAIAQGTMAAGVAQFWNAPRGSTSTMVIGNANGSRRASWMPQYRQELTQHLQPPPRTHFYGQGDSPARGRRSGTPPRRPRSKSVGSTRSASSAWRRYMVPTYSSTNRISGMLVRQNYGDVRDSVSVYSAPAVSPSPAFRVSAHTQPTSPTNGSQSPRSHSVSFQHHTHSAPRSPPQFFGARAGDLEDSTSLFGGTDHGQ